MIPPTFLSDEHIPRAILRAIGSHNRSADADRLESLRVGDPDPLAPPVSPLDPGLIAWCEDHDLILVSLDRSSLGSHLADHLAGGGHSPGVFILRHRFTIQEVVEAILLVSYAADPDDWRDRVSYFPWTS